MDGAFLVDKPLGLSSHSVVAKLRAKHRGVKFGHAGTLDPDASGVLMVLAGSATRIQDVFLGADKEYQGEILLGVSTDSDDTTGKIVSEDKELLFWQKYSKEELVKELIRRFSGNQQQIPPQISAVHVEGKRSYELARSGTRVEHKPRVVEIDFLNLEVVDSNLLAYHIRCSKGTYVRSLARDIGLHLGSFAVAKSIRRIATGSYQIKDCSSLEDTLEGRASFISLERLCADLPQLVVNEEERSLIEFGRQELLAACDISPTAKFGVVLSQESEFIALLRHSPEKGWHLGYVRCREGK